MVFPGAPVRSVSAPWVWVGAELVREGAVWLDLQDLVVEVTTRQRRGGGLPEDRADGVLMPALVNAHTHLELSGVGLVRGGDGLVAWVARLMEKGGSGLGKEGADQAIAAAVRQLVEAGTAAVGDVGNTLAALPALAAARVPGLFFHEFVGSREDRTGDALGDAEREREEYRRRHGWPAELGWVPAPHAPYSVGPELFRRVFAAAARAGHPSSVHVAEDPDELALLADGTGAWAAILERLGVPRGARTPGLTPVAYLASLGAFAGPRPPLLVHMVHAGPEDRQLARRHGATVVLCPRSNLHVGGRLPDVPALRADGVPLALGTDSLASTPDLRLWGELATLAQAFPGLPATLWLEAATAGGAAALGLDRLGSLAAAKRPGLIAVEASDREQPLEGLVRNPAPTIRWMVHPCPPREERANP